MDARSSGGLGYGPFAPPAKSRAPRPLTSRDPLWVEVRRAGEMRALADPWRQLVERALAPSVFAEPGFLLPAFQHIPEGRHAAILCVWQGSPQNGALRGLFPVVAPRLSAAGRDIRIWRPPFSFADAVLVDKDSAEAVLEAALAELAGRGAAAGLLLPQVPLQGPFAAALRAVARRTQRPLDVLRPDERPAAVDRAEPPVEPDRQWRRLRAFGEARIERAREPRPVRDAVEEFLAVEASARGNAALIQDVGTASFVRTMTRELAGAGAAASTSCGSAASRSRRRSSSKAHTALGCGEPPATGASPLMRPMRCSRSNSRGPGATKPVWRSGTPVGFGTIRCSNSL